MVIRFRIASWSSLFSDLVVQPAWIAAAFVVVFALKIWGVGGDQTGPVNWLKVYAGLWAVAALFILVFSIHRLVPEAWSYFKQRSAAKSVASDELDDDDPMSKLMDAHDPLDGETAQEYVKRMRGMLPDANSKRITD